MPPILPKMLESVSNSTKVYALILRQIIYLLETGPCYIPAASYAAVCNFTAQVASEHKALCVTSSSSLT